MKKFSPLISFIVIIGLIAFGTHKIADQQQKDFESNLLPEFKLPLLFDQDKIVTNIDLLNKDYFLINFFASWCISCKKEHELLMNLKENVKIIGIAWRDIDIRTKKLLDDEGNPYFMVLTDSKNEFGSKINLKGTPESYLINKNGEIIFFKRGPLDEFDVNKIKNLINKSN